MGTKLEGDPCLDAAMPDEPMFVLLARDPNMPALVRLWASIRRTQIAEGARPTTDLSQVEEAERLADRAVRWRADADEAWKKQRAFDFVEGTHAEFSDAARHDLAAYGTCVHRDGERVPLSEFVAENPLADQHLARREQDEYVSTRCRKRWGVDEDAPEACA